jgi:Ser/Thr protein kinase RdoA (MazF antagonist)
MADSKTSDDEERRKEQKPAITNEEAAALACRIWPQLLGSGVRKIKPLESYDDQNFYVERVSDGERFLLKVHNGVESAPDSVAVLDAQNAVMLHLAAKGVICSKPIATPAGAHSAHVPLRTRGAGDVPLCVRLLEWVAGDTMNALGDAADGALLEDAGR